MFTSPLGEASKKIMFRHGHHRDQVAYRMKSEHIATFESHQVPWTAELDTALKDSIRSVSRGAGASRQSRPLLLSVIPRDYNRCDGDLVEALVDGGPLNPFDFLVAGLHHSTPRRHLPRDAQQRARRKWLAACLTPHF